MIILFYIPAIIILIALAANNPISNCSLYHHKGSLSWTQCVNEVLYEKKHEKELNELIEKYKKELNNE